MIITTNIRLGLRTPMIRTIKLDHMIAKLRIKAKIKGRKKTVSEFASSVV